MRAILLASLIGIVLTTSSPPMPACAVVPRHGDSVGVNAEEAIILFDAKTGTEHFIRRADFRSEAADFGFLVPTPSQPELGETNASIFQTLHIATLPREVFSGITHRVVRKKNSFSFVGAAVAPSAPQVLEEKTVAGYDAVVLKAEDLDGLKKWLEERKYDARPSVMEWLKKYVENKWIITAFKVSKGADAARDRWAKAVRLSFKTSKCFYPYREPDDMRKHTSPRSLRVFVLADVKQETRLGESVWPGKTVWANTCPEETQKTVLAGMGFKPAEVESLEKTNWYLTEFEDKSSPRPGTDELFFESAKDQSTLERPVIVYDRTEYIDEVETLLDSSNRTILLSAAGVGLALIALIGYFVVIRKRQSE